MSKHWFTSLQLDCTAGSGMHFGVGAMLERLFGNSATALESWFLTIASRFLRSPQVLSQALQRHQLPANRLQTISLPAGCYCMANPFGITPSTGTTGMGLSVARYQAVASGFDAVVTAFGHGIDGIKFLTGDRDGRRLWRSGQIRSRILILT
ncbi:MAG: hypothetical protein AAF215_08950 [Cyanobacteria bacterium P01_A01_bin.123]